MTLMRRTKRFRFSLAFLFATVGVVAMSLGWLCWNIEQVRQRNAALSWIKSHDGFASLYEDSLISNNGEPQRYWEKVSQPRVRLWLGDRPVYYIRLFPTDLAWHDRERIARLFPEAFVVPERPAGFARYSSPRSVVRNKQ